MVILHHDDETFVYLASQPVKLLLKTGYLVLVPSCSQCILEVLPFFIRTLDLFVVKSSQQLSGGLVTSCSDFLFPLEDVTIVSLSLS